MADFFRSTQWQTLIHSKPLAAGLGLVSHFVLNNGEWDHVTHLVGAFWIVAFGALGAIECRLDPRVQSIIGAIQIVGTVAAIYFGSLVTSILIYRAFFHRLRKACLPRNIVQLFTDNNSFLALSPAGSANFTVSPMCFLTTDITRTLSTYTKSTIQILSAPDLVSLASSPQMLFQSFTGR